MKRIRVQFTLLSMIIAVAVIAVLIWVVQALLPKPMTEAQAIWLAEDFIARNGYTDLPVPDGTTLTRESIDFGVTREERLEYRHDTLERKAAWAYRMKDGWVVVFRYKRSITDSRRGVWVDESGKRFQVFHQDVY